MAAAHQAELVKGLGLVKDIPHQLRSSPHPTGVEHPLAHQFAHNRQPRFAHLSALIPHHHHRQHLNFGIIDVAQVRGTARIHQGNRHGVDHVAAQHFELFAAVDKNLLVVAGFMLPQNGRNAIQTIHNQHQLVGGLLRRLGDRLGNEPIQRLNQRRRVRLHDFANLGAGGGADLERGGELAKGHLHIQAVKADFALHGIHQLSLARREPLLNGLLVAAQIF